MLNLEASGFDLLTDFIRDYYRWGIVAVVIILAAMIIIRIWPDRAIALFIVRNVRVSKVKLAEVREQLASVIGSEINESQRAIAEQQLKLQAIRLEIARLQQIVNIKSISMIVGKKLQSIEQEYLMRSKTLNSDKARDALRRVTEKEINDLLRSVDVDPSGLSEFRFPENPSNSEASSQKVAT